MQDGEECAFTMCFRGVDADTLDAVNPEYTSTVRCYMLWVFNGVIQFEDDNVAEAPQVSSLVSGVTGYSVSAWVRVIQGATNLGANQTILAFGSTKNIPSAVGPADTGLSVLASIFWVAQSLDRGAFGYYDDTIGSNFTQPVFAVDQWHCVTVTVAADGAGVLYVDGGLPSFDSAESIDETITGRVTFQTKSRPDNEADYGSLTLGGNFRGVLDEVRVWDKALTAQEVDANIYTRAPAIGVNGLLALLSMTPSTTSMFGETTASMPILSTEGDGQVHQRLPYPGMTPCTLGLSQQVVGPTAGGCVIQVEAWGVDQFGAKLSCKFGDRVVRFQGPVESPIGFLTLRFQGPSPPPAGKGGV